MNGDLIEERTRRENAVNAYNEAKAENERLQKTEYILPARACGKKQMIRVKLDAIRAEAIKKIAERLKEENIYGHRGYISAMDVDALVSKLVGDLK